MQMKLNEMKMNFFFTCFGHALLCIFVFSDALTWKYIKYISTKYAFKLKNIYVMLILYYIIY